jgi:hypothetical protein
MARKCIRRRGNGNVWGAWTEENFREVIKRIETNEIGVHAPF